MNASDITADKRREVCWCIISFFCTGTVGSRQAAIQQLIMDTVEIILSICTSIYQMAENVKANKERCQRVTQRVKALQELVLTIKQRGPGRCSVPVENALKELCTTLTSAKMLMTKYSQTKAVMSFLKSESLKDQFCKMNERLTDHLQVLSGALQVEQGNILYKVYETVAGRKQDEEYCSGRASFTNPTTPMPPPSIMSPMPMCSPTAPVPPPSIMSPMPMCSPTAPVPPPSIMSPMPMCSPTTPVPAPSIMSPMPMCSPTTPMPAPSIMSPMPMCSPTTPMPAPSIMSPMPMCSPTTPVPPPSIMSPMSMCSPTTPVPPPSIMSPMPMCSPVAVRYIMPPRPLSIPMAPMPRPGTMVPVLFSNTAVSSTMAPKPVLRITAPVQAPFAPVTFSTQKTSVGRSCVVNKFYCP
ncbi:pollen-specific leucine-rich repeat extensin-like protein 1 [Chelmon rostratus]|uniref:pollen-specific leucine-rich repeat extensin-like protein 1 n=1 Tax=Chelmon rostratus TaxID=109905 RepID=UPI001BE73B4D|nr:pollen-specific leucine-rich repeat extensin-like protein 1 [Chelmon rostratus]